MLYKDLIKETYSAIVSNRARSALTILGIVIGIASVIALVSIGQGTSTSITQSIEANGANLLTISSGRQRSFGPVMSGQGTAQSLTLDDAEAIKKITSIEAVSPEASSREQITAKKNNTNASINGVYPEYQTVRNIKLSRGIFITQSNIKSSSKVAVLGANVVIDLFGEGVNPLGQAIKVNGLSFKVIGVIEATGSGFNSSDDSVFIPLDVLQRYFSGDKYLSSINVKVASQDKMDQAQTDVTSLLLSLHKISNADEADFNVSNMADLVSMASSVTGTLTILLGAIAGISLLVGGIGIMNMMLTSVTERTREIGLRKAIGAKSSDINKQFLAESIMLTFLGGVIGISLGFLASYLVKTFLNTTTTITTSSVLLAFGVSVAIGVIFGYYPARRAAKLNPIDALRYE